MDKHEPHDNPSAYLSDPLRAEYLATYRQAVARFGEVAAAINLTIEMLADLTLRVGDQKGTPTRLDMLLRVAYTAGLAVGAHYPEYALHILGDTGHPEEAARTARLVVHLHPLGVGAEEVRRA